MTFSYTPATPRDIDRVRFHLADTDAATMLFQDEEITFQIAEAGSWQAAVIVCIQALIARAASEPNFTADWLKVDQSAAIAAWRALLTAKRNELGIAAVKAQGTAVYRGDSLATKPGEGW